MHLGLETRLVLDNLFSHDLGDVLHEGPQALAIPPLRHALQLLYLLRHLPAVACSILNAGSQMPLHDVSKCDHQASRACNAEGLRHINTGPLAAIWEMSSMRVPRCSRSPRCAIRFIALTQGQPEGTAQGVLCLSFPAEAHECHPVAEKVAPAVVNKEWNSKRSWHGS